MGRRRAVIVSASRRTDIPAFHTAWLMAGFRRGWVESANPFRPGRRTRVSLAPEDVDAFVFWTRDARPLLPLLDSPPLARLPSLFLVTLTGYGLPLEPHVPPAAVTTAWLRALAGIVGADRVLWRYDPLVLGDGPLHPDAHRARFRSLARDLEGSTRRVIISLLDWYRKTSRHLRPFTTTPAGPIAIRPAAALDPEVVALVEDLREEARGRGIEAVGCCEPAWEASGVLPAGSCIDGALLHRVFGLPRPPSGDPGQRPGCHCAPSRDIGRTDTCAGGCLYCYATAHHEAAAGRVAGGSPGSTLLCGDEEPLAPSEK